VTAEEAPEPAALGTPEPEPPAFRQRRFEPPPGATDLLLVRHGQSAPYVEGTLFALIDGQGDPPLSAEGEAQARLVGARLAAAGVDAIYVSTMRRTAQTAGPLADRLGLTPVVEARLREVHLGDWEGGVFRKNVAEGHPVALRMGAGTLSRGPSPPTCSPAESAPRSRGSRPLTLASGSRRSRTAV
jgi:2,3-bisphosphoglycerate-dependent phosphoglycerate mutase